MGSTIAIGVLLAATGCAVPGDSSRPPPAPALGVGGPAAAGPLRIERVELRLAGGAPSSVNQGAALAAEASLRTRGSGLLRARWTVDGRVLENVVLNHAGQTALVLRTGPATRLPTFEPGTHELVLEILQPAPGFEPPVLRYFVRPGGARGVPAPAGPA